MSKTHEKYISVYTHILAMPENTRKERELKIYKALNLYRLSAGRPYTKTLSGKFSKQDIHILLSDLRARMEFVHRMR